MTMGPPNHWDNQSYLHTFPNTLRERSITANCNQLEPSESKLLISLPHSQPNSSYVKAFLVIGTIQLVVGRIFHPFGIW